MEWINLVGAPEPSNVNKFWPTEVCLHSCQRIRVVHQRTAWGHMPKWSLSNCPFTALCLFLFYLKKTPHHFGDLIGHLWTDNTDLKIVASGQAKPVVSFHHGTLFPVKYVGAQWPGISFHCKSASFIATWVDIITITLSTMTREISSLGFRQWGSWPHGHRSASFGRKAAFLITFRVRPLTHLEFRIRVGFCCKQVVVDLTNSCAWDIQSFCVDCQVPYCLHRSSARYVETFSVPRIKLPELSNLIRIELFRGVLGIEFGKVLIDQRPRLLWAIWRATMFSF